MLGTGRAHVAEICDIARANVASGLKSGAVASLASCGKHGEFESNQERDLHRWLHSLFGMELSTYSVPFTLDVSCLA